MEFSASSRASRSRSTLLPSFFVARPSHGGLLRCPAIQHGLERRLEIQILGFVAGGIRVGDIGSDQLLPHAEQIHIRFETVGETIDHDRQPNASRIPARPPYPTEIKASGGAVGVNDMTRHEFDGITDRDKCREAGHCRVQVLAKTRQQLAGFQACRWVGIMRRAHLLWPASIRHNFPPKRMPLAQASGYSGRRSCASLPAVPSYRGTGGERRPLISRSVFLSSSVSSAV